MKRVSAYFALPASLFNFSFGHLTALGEFATGHLSLQIRNYAEKVQI
ncbi:MAG: hypothetical protein JW715_15120 [Sedimentisphaerales bacterium]|nr:hypothetical protein [Sedimentisphaerales bacterium]